MLGYTDTSTVMLDFDDVPFHIVKHWATWTLEHFQLGGLLMLKSSHHHYHVIFDRTVSWITNISIMASVCIVSKHAALQKWFLLQCRKEASTLRLSAKGMKPSPRIVYRDGEQHNEIQQYLRERRRFKHCWKHSLATFDITRIRPRNSGIEEVIK